jgi:hypothetical protein
MLTAFRTAQTSTRSKHADDSGAALTATPFAP